MERRQFMHSAFITGASVLVGERSILAALRQQGTMKGESTMAFTLPNLPYAFDALEPYIDKMTMEIHHDKHHGAYVTNLNKAVEGSEWSSKSIEDILANVSKLPAAVRNNGGGHYNHSLFWTWMKPKTGGTPLGELAEAIKRDFGSFDKFKEQFANAAMTRFGSGWAWLVKQHDKVVICSTPNQDNPMMDLAEVKGVPLVGVDVWEHAYYLKYQNRRADYLAAWWNVVNWDEVANRFASAK